MNCEVCGYSWQARVENPKECPECKSRKWKFGGSKTPRVGSAREPEGNPVGRVATVQELQDIAMPRGKECSDCGEAMLENRKFRKWICKCGYQEPL